MKKLFLKRIKVAIKKQYPNYSEEKIDEIMYGVEGLYLTVTKTIIIFTISIILGIFKELLTLLIMFNLIRVFAFGMHANSSVVCLVFSCLLFIGGSYLSKLIIIPINVLCLLYFIALIIILIYSPADTVKRPLIKKKKRIIFKICSVIIAVSFFIISLFIKNDLIINSFIIGLLIECLLILPITYKVFKLPYKNYVNYGLNT